MFEVKAITGYQISRGIKEGRVWLGKSPVRTVVLGEFKDLTMLLFTTSSIEQANTDPNRKYDEVFKQSLEQNPPYFWRR
jgi:hypothetical protein